jgi:hypothetical protein
MGGHSAESMDQQMGHSKVLSLVAEMDFWVAPSV